MKTLTIEFIVPDRSNRAFYNASINNPGKWIMEQLMTLFESVKMLEATGEFHRLMGITDASYIEIMNVLGEERMRIALKSFSLVEETINGDDSE